MDFNNWSLLITLLINRVAISLITVPTSYDEWLQGLLLLLIYSLIALPLGFSLGFLQWKFYLNKSTVIRVAVTSLVAPAILEELFFRSLLLPHPSENLDIKSICVWSLVSLFLFVIYHPANGLTFFPAGRKTFSDPIFLILAFLLGVFCTIAYLHTGSIWISIFIHWLTVVVWLLCLGGIERLGLYENN